MQGPQYPDIRYIKTRVPIREVARELGLHLSETHARCWRPERHEDGDRTPSVGLHRRKNIARCFVCDPHALSNVDLVMSVLGLETGLAVRWIADRFDVSTVKAGAHVRRPLNDLVRVRGGVGVSRLEALVRSGLWARLSGAERSILAVLDAMADPSTDGLRISYRGLMRYGGIGSPSTIAAALKSLRKLHLFDIEKRSEDDGFRACNRYVWTLEDPRFRATLSEVARCHREEIEAERAIQAEARSARRFKRANTLPVQVNLSTARVARHDLTVHPGV
jgi:hypothetical protein